MLARSPMALALLFTILSSANAADPSHGKMNEVELFAADDIKWIDGPPSLPKGASIAVLEGDPTKKGPFVFRVKVPDGYRIPPHTHPKTERITVISGTFHIGMGDTIDAKATEAMPTGTYGHWPRGMKHFVWVKGETIVQFHGDGPWTINYVNPADDPRTAPAPRTASARTAVDFTEDSLEVVKRNIAEEKAVLVDVRSKEEWDQGYIEGSLFVPVTSLRKHSLNPVSLAETLPAKKEEKILYTFCVVGMRAKQAAKILQEQGYNVRALQPGYEKLIEAGFKKADEDTRQRNAR
jgi:rhodanese-related sulfurtransferase/quercetin dioxygenase-like cupin family protein